MHFCVTFVRVGVHTHTHTHVHVHTSSFWTPFQPPFTLSVLPIALHEGLRLLLPVYLFEPYPQPALNGKNITLTRPTNTTAIALTLPLSSTHSGQSTVPMHYHPDNWHCYCLHSPKKEEAWRLLKFSIAAITNYLKLRGLKQQKYIIFGQKSEVGFTGLKPKVSAELHVLWKLWLSGALVGCVLTLHHSDPSSAWICHF